MQPFPRKEAVHPKTLTTVAKKKSYPKAPKAKASKEVWANYEKRCAEIKKHNDAIDKVENEKTKIKERVNKMKAK